MARWNWNVENFSEFRRIRKGAAMVAELNALAIPWVNALNAELYAAQAARGQPIETGYTWHISNDGDRARLHIIAATARAQAHERVHQSILKLMNTTGEAPALKSAADAAKAERKAKRDARMAARDAAYDAENG